MARAVAVIWLLASVTACAQLAPRPSDRAAEPRTEAIYVLAFGWHTELALPVSLIDDGLAALKRDFPGARFLAFGWGARDYYTAPNPGLAEAMRALSPGPAVMLVMGFPATPSENASVVFVSREGIARLSHWLLDELAKDPDGKPHRIAAGPYPQSVFYTATGSYDMTHTCNTWTAEGLQVAGLPVATIGVIFADQVTGHLAPFATPTLPQQVTR